MWTPPARTSRTTTGTEVYVHPSAEIEDGALIGAGTSIWHLTHVRTGARIGAGVTLGRNVFVDAGVHIGDRCKVQNNVSVYRGVTLAEEVFVGPSAVFTNDRNPRATGDWQIGETMLRRGSSIGAGAVLVCGIDIGEGALVGAGAVVTKDVPAWALMLGNPARQVGWVCRCGIRTTAAGGRCDHDQGDTEEGTA
ncbi:MAG: N-acetyltransferase [Micrococcales bacterium]|nr:MAG: N-acetyltransferase [Micrococcales bacterium]PIE27798.1 MAG: N-acetyltransferase [Micrococcales bacterium]